MNLYEGIKVIDLTNNIAGPLCGAMLADYGAEVIHIEKPVLGDDNRSYVPRFDGVSCGYMSNNNAKKSVVIDLKDSRGVAAVKKMVEDADIFIESSRPGVMDRLGLGYEQIKAINPKIVYCSISAFGQKGPYAERAGYDVIAQAVSGLMHMTGDPEGPPMKIGNAIGDFAAALNAFGCIGHAMYYREVTGKGQHIDVALARNLMWMGAVLDYRLTGHEVRRMGNHHYSLSPYGIFNNKKGESLVIAVISQKLWVALCNTMKRPELIDDPKYATNEMRVRHQKDLVTIIETWLDTFEMIADASKILEKAGIPCSKVYTHKDINDDPHVNECGWLVDVPVPNGVTSINARRIIGHPFSFSEFSPVYRKAATLGEHNHEVLEAIGFDADEVDELEAEWEAKAKKR